MMHPKRFFTSKRLFTAATVCCAAIVAGGGGQKETGLIVRFSLGRIVRNRQHVYGFHFREYRWRIGKRDRGESDVSRGQAAGGFSDRRKFVHQNMDRPADLFEYRRHVAF